MKSLRIVSLLVALFATTVAGFATIGATYQMQLGNPSNATTTTTDHSHYLIQRDQYAMDYNDANGEPNWVSWDLTTGDVGSSGRSNFIQDTTLPVGFYQVLTTDYSGSGYDRGHMCPSADRTVTVADNQVVFYMSNMVPQAPDNNQGVWANFETYCRTLAGAGNELLITCGPGGFSGSRLPSSAAAIPGFVWKIVVVVPVDPTGTTMAIDRITPATRVIAIKIPNVAGVRSDPWQNYITSVSQIEAATGLTFFTALPAPLASTLRTVVDGETASGVPVITTQPSTTTTVVGGSASFTVAASGTAPFTYQWFHDDVAVDGATDATLSLSGVTASDAGSYDVVVSNSAGSVTSNAASLIIAGIPPSITSQPASITVNAGTNLTLAVAATGSPTLTYQWRKNLAPILGATSSALVVLDAQAGNAGDYDVVVSNSVNSVTSTPATVVVNPAAPTITAHPASVTAAINGIVTFNVTATGTEPLTYQWRKDTVDLVGATTPSLTLAGVSATTAGSYDVVVTNGLGFATSNAAVLTVTAATPSTIYWNFTAATPTSGLPADVTGGTVTQGNNNGTTTLITATSASGTYAGASGGGNAGAAARIGALNQAAGGSAYFEFTLTPAAGKSLQATALNFGARSTSTGPQAYAVYTSVDGYAAPVASGTLTNNSVWTLLSPTMTAVTGTDGTPVTFRIFGYNGAGSAGVGTANWRIDDLHLTIATLASPVTGVAPTVTSTTPANGAVDISASSGITLAFSAPVAVTGQWFTITSAATGTVAATVTGGPSTFTLTPPISFADNDLITVTVLAAQVVDQATGSAHLASNYSFSFTTAASSAPVPPSIITQPSSQAAIVGDTVSFTVAPSGTAPFAYQWRKTGNPILGNPSATTATLTLAGVTTLDAGFYDCVVTNVAGNTISNTATLTVTALPPTLTTQPASQAVTVGGTATFGVTVTGTAPFTYQWSKDGVALADGNGVSGATTATLSISPVDPTDAGVYSVVVGNTVTSVPSANAVLAVGTSLPSTILWNFTVATPTSGLPADVTGGTVTQGNNNGTTTLLTTVSASSGYAGVSGTFNAGAAARVGALNRAANGSAYFEFTLAPTPAAKLVVSALSFGTRSTGTGPQAFAIYSSADSFTTPVATGTLLNNSAWTLQTPAVTPITGAIGAPLTFRLYGYNGAGGATANTANWRIDDLSVTLRTLATPPVLTGTAPLNGATSVAVTTPIALTFNQPVNVTGSWATVTSAAHGPVSVAISGGAGSYMLTPLASLPYGDTITVTVAGAQVTDLTSGLFAMGTDAVFSFSTALPPAPVVTADPLATHATAGDSITLSVSVDSPVPVTYEWRKGGLPIAGNPTAATANLVLNPVHTADAGSYDCFVTNPGGDATSAAAVLTVDKATASVVLGQLSAGYDGTPKSVTVTTVPTPLNVTVTYDGAAAVPVNAGSYAVVATVDDADYSGTAAGTLVIHPATAIVTLGALNQAFDGTPKSITVATVPSGLPVAVTYAGGVPPTAAGTYAVSATVTDPNYSGSATGDLVISTVPVTITVTHLHQPYTGAPRPVDVTVTPDGVTYAVTYNGSATVPTLPGVYAVNVTLTDPNYTGSANAVLEVTATALVNHGGSLNGTVDGSLQLLTGESFTLNGASMISGDLLLPGTPTIRRNGRGAYGALLDGSGNAAPTGYTVTLNGNALVGRVLRRVNPIALPVVAAPAAPTGTRTVSLNRPGQNPGDFATLRNLTLNGNADRVTVPAGNYGNFTANNGGFVLGVAGATEPSVYAFQNLVLNGDAEITVVGPVVITLANGPSLNGSVGCTSHPEWLTLRIASGGLTLNGNVTFCGTVLAPRGTITINGRSELHGQVACDRLVINGDGALEDPAQPDADDDCDSPGQDGPGGGPGGDHQH